MTSSLSLTGLESLTIQSVLEGLNVISPEIPQKLAKTAPPMTGNRGKEYLYLIRQGQKALQDKRSFRFYPLYEKVKGKPSVLAADESGITIGENEQEKVNDLNCITGRGRK